MFSRKICYIITPEYMSWLFSNTFKRCFLEKQSTNNPWFYIVLKKIICYTISTSDQLGARDDLMLAITFKAL